MDLNFTACKDSRFLDVLWDLEGEFISTVCVKEQHCTGESKPQLKWKGLENATWTQHLDPHVHCGIIYSSEDMGATFMPIVKGMDKEGVVIYTMG